MRIAKWAKALGMKTHYYISTNLGMEESRISAIKRDIDKMYVILPFENNFEDKHHFPVAFGHPLIDAIKISLQSMPLL
jgi:lipid-A-disaccharide synthase